MGTPDPVISDLDRIEQALVASRRLATAFDEATAARALAADIQYSPLRTLCELGEQAFERIRAQMDPPVPPTEDLETGESK